MARNRITFSTFVVCAVGTFACFLCWALPLPKLGAAFGRFNYWQFLLAIGATLCFLSVLVVQFAPVKRRRGAAFRTITVWAGVLASLGAWELLAAWLPGSYYTDQVRYTETESSERTPDSLPFGHPPHLHWRGTARGDLAIIFQDDDPYAKTVTFQTDYQGFRNQTDRQRAEIVFVGDSFTEAGNVDEHETFVQIVGQKLHTTVRNLGRYGYSPSTELIVLKQFGLPCEPKTVVWQVFEYNDLDDELKYQRWLKRNEHYFDEDSVFNRGIHQNWKRRSPSYRLFNQFRDAPPWPLGGPLQGFFRTDVRQITPVRFLEPVSERQRPVDHEGWPLIEKAVREGAALLAENNIRLVVLFIPMKYRILAPYVEFPPVTAEALLGVGDIPRKQTLAYYLERLCKELQVDYVDVTDRFRTETKGGKLVYLPLDTHLSPFGHTVVAEELVKTLE